MPKGTVQYKWTLMGLTKQEGSRQVNCHPLLSYSIPAPLPINYINFSQMTACSKLHWSQNEVQMYKFGTQSPSRSGCNYLSNAVFHYKHPLKLEWVIYCLTQILYTCQPLAFFYDIPPRMAERARGLK